MIGTEERWLTHRKKILVENLFVACASFWLLPAALSAGINSFARSRNLIWVTATPDMRFKYGSIGAEHDAGIPYWIFFVLPRMFPEKLPGPGGYASLGVAWEQGQELPIGFTKKAIGFPRVANNCASCHTASYRKSAERKSGVLCRPGPTIRSICRRFFASSSIAPRIRASTPMRS